MVLRRRLSAALFLRPLSLEQPLRLNPTTLISTDFPNSRNGKMPNGGWLIDSVLQEQGVRIARTFPALCRSTQIWNLANAPRISPQGTIGSLLRPSFATRRCLVAVRSITATVFGMAPAAVLNVFAFTAPVITLRILAGLARTLGTMVQTQKNPQNHETLRVLAEGISDMNTVETTVSRGCKTGFESSFESDSLHCRINWCPEEDSNLHTFRHTDLNRARLPIPPPGHCG